MPSADLLALGVVWSPLLCLITHETLKMVKQLEYTKELVIPPNLPREGSRVRGAPALNSILSYGFLHLRAMDGKSLNSSNP